VQAAGKAEPANGHGEPDRSPAGRFLGGLLASLKALSVALLAGYFVLVLLQCSSAMC